MSASNDKTIGVIGGLGPAATMDFCSRIIRLTPVNCEQDHLRLLIDNNPKAEDRNRAIAGIGESPVDSLVQSAIGLEKGGADFLVMPCNTAHAFAPQIAAAVSVPMINIIDEVVSSLSPDLTRIGVLATDGCRMTNLYQDVLHQARLETIYLDAEHQKQFMHVVYQIKQGLKPEHRQEMQKLARLLVRCGAQVVIAGCTEVPLSLDQSEIPVPLIDSTEVLAIRAVAYAKNHEMLFGTSPVSIAV